MHIFSTKNLPWILFTIVITIPLIAWLHAHQWIIPVRGIIWFPLLGVWAWSIMWTHYAYGAIQLHRPDTFKSNELYSRISTWLVLLLIILHPGLLAYHQYNIFNILPPESYTGYVASSMEIFIYFGIISLLLYLSYEVFTRLRQMQSIQRIWGWVSVSQIIAMALIFFHGLAIGDSVLYGWSNAYWILLGVLLIPASFIVAKNDFTTQKNASIKNKSS